MKLKTFVHVFVLLAALLAAGLSSAQEDGGSSIGAADDCSDISVDFDARSDLTEQERIRLMDRALLKSLNKYERCQMAQERSAAAGGGAAGNGGGSGDGGGGGAGGQGSSTASSEMSGTEVSGEQEAASSLVSSELPTSKPEGGTPEDGTHLPGSGKIPDDIPPADNDSVLEEQIRQAAMNETDPVIKEKLWNEYRKYKGLPAVTKP